MAVLSSSGLPGCASLDALSSSGLGYTPGPLNSIRRSMSLSHRKIGEPNQVSCGHSSYHCPKTSFRSSVSPNTNEKHASLHLCTLHTPGVPSEVHLSTRVFSLAWPSSVHSRSTRCAFSFGIRTCGIPFASVNADHLLMVHHFAIWITRCATSR